MTISAVAQVIYSLIKVKGFDPKQGRDQTTFFWTNLGQLSAAYKSRDKGRESISAVFIVKYSLFLWITTWRVQNGVVVNNDTVTLMTENTNAHANIREM